MEPNVSSTRLACATDMRRGTWILVLALTAGVVAFFIFRKQESQGRAQPPVLAGLDVSPLCPWRDPQRDLPILFPPHTNYILETRILSSMTAPIRKRLGRHMNPDENPLRIFRVGESGSAGAVLVTRVKGEDGAIEIVTGVTSRGTVQGVLIQSQREPDAVAQVITGSNFLASFVGRNASAPLRLGEDLPAVPALAHTSAQAIADGVRSELIVLSFAGLPLEERESGIRIKR